MGEFCDSVSLGPTKLEEFKLVLKRSLKKILHIMVPMRLAFFFQ